MKTTSSRTLAAVALCLAFGGAMAQSRRHAESLSSVELSKRLVGRWENDRTGFELLSGGGIVFFREAGGRVYRSGMYCVQPGNRVRIERAGGRESWIVKKVTPNELWIVDAARHERRYRRVKLDAAARRSAAVRCETIMRTILTAEDQYEIDHAFYKAIGPGESFVRAGLLGSEPRCPAGGRYTVVLDEDGRPVVHCSVKEHDFGGRGLR